MTVPTNCPICQSSIRYIKAGVSRKTGKPYNEFWACSNRECDFTWRPKKKTNTPSTRDAVLMEEIQDFRKHLDERLDNLGKYLKEKL